MRTHDLSVVYIVRKGEVNHELKYSLRTIEKNMPHKDVWIVGYRPSWVNQKTTNYIPTPQRGSILENSLSNIFAGCQHPGITDDYILTHDDFHCIAPVEDVGLNNHGYYTTEPRSTDPRKLANHYYTCNRNTYQYLRDRDIEKPINFELHMPMLVNKAKFLQLKELVSPDIKYLATMDKISLYGNLHNLAHLGTTVRDVKARQRTDPMPSGPWVSTWDGTFFQGETGRYLVKNYPLRSRYER